MSLVVLQELERLLSRHTFRFTSEDELQRAIHNTLLKAAIPCEREFRLSPKDRLDFLVRSSVAIEVKTSVSLASLTKQVHRYTLDERIQGVLVVSSRVRLANLPLEFNGKPVRVHVLLTSLL